MIAEIRRRRNASAVPADPDHEVDEADGDALPMPADGRAVAAVAFDEM